MREKRLLIISTEFPPGPGGIGFHAFYLVKELRQLGWDVTVASDQEFATDAEIETFNSKSPYPVYRLFPIPSGMLLIRKVIFLAKLILKHKPNVIMGTGKHGSWFAYLLSRLFFKKCVLIGHGTEFTAKMSERSQKINRWVYSHCHLLASVSHFTLLKAHEVGITAPKEVVLHNGADSDIFTVAAPKDVEQFKLQKQLTGKKIILTVGHVSSRKGQEWVVRAMPDILKKVPNAHYYCVGRHIKYDEIKQLTAELNVQHHVHFMGVAATGEVALWMNACDIFAMTSCNVSGDFEGFGIAVIEAALCGKPAIVTNQSGLQEAIIEGQTGFGAKEKDFATIAQRAIALLTDPALMSKTGEQALKNASENLTWRKVAARYDELMAALIK